MQCLASRTGEGKCSSVKVVMRDRGKHGRRERNSGGGGYFLLLLYFTLGETFSSGVILSTFYKPRSAVVDELVFHGSMVAFRWVCSLVAGQDSEIC